MQTIRSKFAVWLIDTLVPAVFPRLNPAIRRLLKSPLHFVASWYVLLVRFEGRRTGKRYEVPVAFHQSKDGALEVVTSAEGIWWRNLRGVDEASVTYRGRERVATVALVEEDAERIRGALDSRDFLRRMLVPVSPRQTVLLRFHLQGE
jgi:hypothetical protein